MLYGSVNADANPEFAVLLVGVTILPGTATPRPAAVNPPMTPFRPRPAIEDLRISQQLRRSWAPDDLDYR